MHPPGCDSDVGKGEEKKKTENNEAQNEKTKTSLGCEKRLLA